MQGEVGVDLAVPAGDGGGDQRVLVQHLADEARVAGEFARLQHPQVQAAQALAGQPGQPLARHGGAGADRLALAEALRLQWHGEGPGDELGVQFPTDAKRPQVHAQMGGVRIRLGRVVVAQQRRQVRAAGLAAGLVGQHDDVQAGHGRRDRLGRAGMDFVVQLGAQRVLRRPGVGPAGRCVHGRCIA